MAGFLTVERDAATRTAFGWEKRSDNVKSYVETNSWHMNNLKGFEMFEI